MCAHLVPWLSKCETLNIFYAQVAEQKMRLLMLLESKDVQLTLLNEMLVQKAYTVSDFINMS